MAYAQGAQGGLSYIVETGFGTTPGSPAMIALPINTHSLNLTKGRVAGNEIQPDRMPRVDRHGQRSAAGQIVGDLRAGDFDDLLECAFLNNPTTSGVRSLTVGTTPQYLTIEDRQTDINQYRQFTGMTVSQLAVSIAPDQMVTVTFDMVGQDMEISGTSLDPSPDAPTGNEPFDSFTGTISEGGSAIAIVTGLDFTLTNSFAPAFAVGSQTAAQLEVGRAVVEGTVTAYFEDAVLINKFINETESSISVRVLDPSMSSSEAYTFTIPRVKYNGADVPLSDEQSRIITLPFVGLYDSSSGTNIQLDIGV